MNWILDNSRNIPKTKTKAIRTIVALIIIGAIIAFPLAITDKVAFASDPKKKSSSSSASSAATTSTATGTALKLTAGKTPVVIPVMSGLYDSKGVSFITTEVSDKAMKDQMGNFTGNAINYAPNLTKAQDIGDLWIFKNGVKGAGLMGFQVTVFNSIPGDPAYTPLWRVNFAEWKTTGTNATTPTILGSDDIIADAVKKGQITVTPTKVVVNCPIVQWGGNKDNTIPAGHI
jgi:hypothetical protein